MTDNISDSGESVFGIKVTRTIQSCVGNYDIDLDPDGCPVQNRPRKIPLSMKTEEKAKLESLEKLGVLEKVKEPTPLISNMPPVRKANGTIR